MTKLSGGCHGLKPIRGFGGDDRVGREFHALTFVAARARGGEQCPDIGRRPKGRGERSAAYAQGFGVPGRSQGSKALSCHQLDFDLLAERASSTIESSESDRSILRI